MCLEVTARLAGCHCITKIYGALELSKSPFGLSLSPRLHLLLSERVMAQRWISRSVVASVGILDAASHR